MVNMSVLSEQEIKEIVNQEPTPQTPAPAPVEEVHGVHRVHDNQPEERERLIQEAVRNTMIEIERRAEEKRQLERSNNPALIAEDLIAFSGLPDYLREDAMEEVKLILENEPTVSPQTAQNITKAVIAKKNQDFVAHEEMNRKYQDQKTGAIYRKYGESGHDIINKFFEYSETLGLTKEFMQKMCDSVTPEAYINQIEMFRQNVYLKGGAQTVYTESLSQKANQKAVEDLKRFFPPRAGLVKTDQTKH